MARTNRLVALAVGAAALLLTGCASATASPAASPSPAPSSTEASHAMPDGSTMSGAEHGGDSGDAVVAAEPSAAAQMICGGQVVTAVAAIFGIPGVDAPESSWQAPTYTCTFDIDGAPLELTVHDTADAAAGQAHFDQLQESLGADDIEGLLGLGLPSFSTGEGVVGFLKDGRTLTVDATAVPDGFAGGSRTQEGAAYAVASAVLTCWVQHD
ncbi:hypothetical protein [Agrococcus beijingensis]|uniref:hypothetical protein n=1 Tax=Agrococcus beijingensis TaxID=3068634 RepID=UPI0027414D4B|nr:hypothetical protein [Agrococcus sp. REN33]